MAPKPVRIDIMLIAQISDLHVNADRAPVFAGFDTQSALARVVRDIDALEPQPDIVLATGDLVCDGELREYEVLKEVLAPLRAPLYAIPGNHDDRNNLMAVFGPCAPAADDADGFIQYVIEDFPVRIVMLDSLLPGAVGGTLCARRLGWLEKTLAAETEKPTIVALHHPPFMSGIETFDDWNCSNGDKLAEIVARHANVERVICGHVHRAIEVRFGGTIAGACPSTAFAFAADLRPGAPPVATEEPSGYQLHLWRPESGLVTHTVAAGYPIVPPHGNRSKSSREKGA